MLMPLWATAVVNLEVIDNKGQTPLDLAVQRLVGDAKIAAMLREAGAKRTVI